LRATEQAIDLFGVNVRGAIFPFQKARQLTSDVSQSSSWVDNGLDGTADFGVDCASETAIRNFEPSWTLELKGRESGSMCCRPASLLELQKK
jgi:hypothetical protein